MLARLAKQIFGSRNERLLRNLGDRVAQINAFEPGISTLDDAALRAKTTQFREQLAVQEGQTLTKMLDSILPEAFAVVREAAKRTLKLRHFDVQLIGGMVLHSGKIAEMRTGEGKTLMATLPTYLNALTGKGVHIVTVNDYLARRDAEWMRPIFEFLGLTVGVVVSNMRFEDKQAAYRADVIYGTNNEFGFDYLRDNMAFSLNEKVQRDLNFAIVDEVDSILIDEARTPLIISGTAEESSEYYHLVNRIVPKLVQQKEENGPGDFTLDEKQRQAYLTEAGHEQVERLLIAEGTIGASDSLYDAKNIVLMHHLNAALRAHYLYQRDVDYIVANNEVIIVDEHTGRTMPGRRWSEGLHQAVEAKEGAEIQNENQTLASITFQNYFRLYQKLSGMTGTADTEAYEFQQIYGLEVVVIPTNKPMIREDCADQIYLTQQEKFDAIIEDIKQSVARNQPILVGTASIETSEYLSGLLQKMKITHQVLNAKQHEKEAHVIAQAGRPGTVTIATNMAGRGTDIVLGGNLEAEIATMGENPDLKQVEECKKAWEKRHQQVIDAGGLYVLGTERHESRRIDNQLRGRSGRQGDPGLSRFYLSLEDNLMRIFASARVSQIMKRLGLRDGESIEHPFITRAIANAQRKVEGHNFDIRKQLLEFDDVANEQRKRIYARRNELMAAEDISADLATSQARVIDELIERYIPSNSFEEQWNVQGLQNTLRNDFVLNVALEQWLRDDVNLNTAELHERIKIAFFAEQKAKFASVEQKVLHQIEKSVMLQSLDLHWREHLAAMDYLRQGIHLRGYAQKNPTQEYKREAFFLFQEMLGNVEYNVVSTLARVTIQTEEDAKAMEAQRRSQLAVDHTKTQHADAVSLLSNEPKAADISMPASELLQDPFVRHTPKVGRNEPCPCGSGRKYKQCHGRIS
ncbi:MAG: preprotein translocase, SecA subunit [Gammaproteobacteria bacterium]|jgi:preprotein translocase subunit SecA|nr:preprotein translocase, SecA subunit [Gammaproteobacteria bacterium]